MQGREGLACSSHHEDIARAAVPIPRGDAVEFGEELRDDPVHDAARVAVRAALGSGRSQLVEDDTRVGIAHTLEYTTDVHFQLSNLHVQQLGAFDRKEVQQVQGRDHLGEKGLACARRSIKKDPHGPKT